MHQIVGEILQPGARQFQQQMLGARSIGGDERQVDLRFHHTRELALGLFRSFVEPLESLPVSPEVNTRVLAKLIGQPVDDALVEIIPTEVCVPRSGAHLTDPFPHIENGDVKGPAAKVEDQDGLILLLFQTVSQSCRRGLVDDPEHLEPGDVAGILGGLTLRIIEIGGHRNDRFIDLFTEILGRVIDQLSDHLG